MAKDVGKSHDTKKVSKKGQKKGGGRRRSEERRLRRLGLLLALEVRRIMEDLIFRKGLLLEVWSKMRVRAPLLRVLKSRYDDVSAEELLSLPVSEIMALDRFYRQVDEFRLYLETTEDMPRSMENQYDLYTRQLEALGVVVLEGLRPLHGEELAGAGAGVKGGEIMEFGPLLELPALQIEANANGSIPTEDKKEPQS